MIQRFSSRRSNLSSVLVDGLSGATAYDRIAGYFRSSILEIAGEALESMQPGAVVRVIANSELDALDVLTARAAQQEMTREWHQAIPEDLNPATRERLRRLGDFLQSGRMVVRVLPDDVFGMIHGKAGVIHRADSSAIAFMGSANESRRAWSNNYEIVWTDESPEGIAWVQEEFDALWGHPSAQPLADAVVTEIQRLVRRTVVPDLGAWKIAVPAPDASAVIELPIYRQENGLWAHQKWFVRKAFELHKAGGARLVLADQVGLGKTVQLALAAKLMLLWSGGNALALVPKPLLTQWQNELWNLLQLPSAVWLGDRWQDERGVIHPLPLSKCPRRFGIVSTGLIRQSSEVAGELSSLPWQVVILDEAHHARRKNLGPKKRGQKAEPNNLLAFLDRIAARARSVLLATATPVQLDPIEAWDLLDALNRNNASVLGGPYSRWNQFPWQGLDLVSGREAPSPTLSTRWFWMRDPFPPSTEDRDYKIIRGSLGASDSQTALDSNALDKLSPGDRRRLESLSDRFFQDHNPYIRHIVRRTREYLEDTIDPTTNEPFLPRVAVRLFGESGTEALGLSGYVRDAYLTAEAFCEEVGKRPGLNSGFLKTLLLRRIGSTIIAGERTARKMLGSETELDAEGEDEDQEEIGKSSLYPLQPAEEELLLRFLKLLDQAGDQDPKYGQIEEILLHGADGTEPWLRRGCIVFTQYLDSARWIAERLSARLPDEAIALYGGGTASGIYRAGEFTRVQRDTIKRMVQSDEIRLMIGTEAASEGLNLQRLGTLINLDLPWNPTRLEQRKGRIQRIGQPRSEVYIYNLRYRDSVEDRVHQLLSSRLATIHAIFGQLPDTLEDVWVAVAERDEEKARQIIDAVPVQHPFEIRYDKIEHIDWETCSEVLDSQTQLDALLAGWNGK